MPDFKSKMLKIRFRLELCPRPSWRAYSAPQTQSGFGVPLLREGRGIGERRERRGEEGSITFEGKSWQRSGTPVVANNPLTSPHFGYGRSDADQ